MAFLLWSMPDNCSIVHPWCNNRVEEHPRLLVSSAPYAFRDSGDGEREFGTLFPACCICCAKWSFLSKMTPRYRASCDGSIVVPVIVMFAVGVVLLLVKCVRTYFVVSKRAPWPSLHFSALINILSSSLALCTSDSPCTPYAMSSMNPRLSPLLPGTSSKSAL